MWRSVAELLIDFEDYQPIFMLTLTVNITIFIQIIKAVFQVCSFDFDTFVFGVSFVSIILLYVIFVGSGDRGMGQMAVGMAQAMMNKPGGHAS